MVLYTGSSPSPGCAVSVLIRLVEPLLMRPSGQVETAVVARPNAVAYWLGRRLGVCIIPLVCPTTNNVMFNQSL